MNRQPPAEEALPSERRANDRAIAILNDLIQRDREAVAEYDRAIARVDLEAVAADLEAFKVDHERHVARLSSLVERLGGQPATGRDLKGVLLEGYTAVRSITGTEGALNAMRSNEKGTYDAYEAALAEPLPDEVRSLIAAHRADEERHMLYLEGAVTNRVWLTGVGHVAGTTGE